MDNVQFIVFRILYLVFYVEFDIWYFVGPGTLGSGTSQVIVYTVVKTRKKYSFYNAKKKSFLRDRTIVPLLF